MDQLKELEPLISMTIETVEDGEWGQQIVEELTSAVETEVPPEHEDAFWVKVTLVKGEGVKRCTMPDEGEKLQAEANKALGRELLCWRVDAVYPTEIEGEGVASLLLLMNTVSLQDIMELGA